jgi:hypothetical protein
MLFAEPPEKNAPKLGDPNVVNIMDYKVDNTGKTLDTDKINQAIRDVSARPVGGVLFFPAGVYLTGSVDTRWIEGDDDAQGEILVLHPGMIDRVQLYRFP